MKLLVDQVNNAETSVLYTPVFSDSTRGLKETGLGTCLQNDIAHQKLKDMQVPQIKGGVTTPFKPTSNLQLELHVLSFFTYMHILTIYFTSFFSVSLKRPFTGVSKGALKPLLPTQHQPRRRRQAAKHPLRVGHLDLDGHLLSARLQPSLALAGPWPVLGTGHGPQTQQRVYVE